jgi:hypothetical protein
MNKSNMNSTNRISPPPLRRKILYRLKKNSRMPMQMAFYNQSVKSYCPSCSIYKKNNY